MATRKAAPDAPVSTSTPSGNFIPLNAAEVSEGGQFLTSFRGTIRPGESWFIPHRFPPSDKPQTGKDGKPMPEGYQLKYRVMFDVHEVLDDSDFDISQPYEHVWGLGGTSLARFCPSNDGETPAGGSFQDYKDLASGRDEDGNKVSLPEEEVPNYRGKRVIPHPDTPDAKRRLNEKCSFIRFLADSELAIPEPDDTGLTKKMTVKKKGKEEEMRVIDMDKAGAESLAGVTGVWDTKKISTELGEQRVLVLTSFDGIELPVTKGAAASTSAKKTTTPAPASTPAAATASKATTNTTPADDGDFSAHIQTLMSAALPEDGSAVPLNTLTRDICTGLDPKLRSNGMIEIKKQAQEWADILWAWDGTKQTLARMAE